jgi:hypothetical protein
VHSIASFVSIVLLGLCCRLNRSPASASHSAAISVRSQPCGSHLVWPDTPAIVTALVDACVGRLCHAFIAFLLFGSVVYAEYTSRQSPVHSPVSAQPLLQSFRCESMPHGGRLSFSLLNSFHILLSPMYWRPSRPSLSHGFTRRVQLVLLTSR